jgi:hypothetical protein
MNDQEQVELLREALRACLEDSMELLAERHWWEDEARGGYSGRYLMTKLNIERANEALEQTKP